MTLTKTVKGFPMKRVLSYLKNYRLESILGPLFKLLEAGFDLVVPFVVAQIIDAGIPQGEASGILKPGLTLVGLALLGLCCAAVAQYFAAKAAVGLASDVRHALFEKLGKMSYTDLDRIGASTIITRMTSDLDRVQTGVNLGLRLFLRSPFIVFGAAVMAFTIDTSCALIFIPVILLLSAIVFGIMLGAMPMHRREQRQLDGLTLATRENLSGVRVMRAYGREQDEAEAFEKKHEALTKLQTASGRIGALMNPLSCLVVNGALILLIHSGAIRVNAGALTQGQVVALVNYLSQILVELVKLADLIITTSRAAACGDRIGAILDMKPGEDKPEKPLRPLRDLAGEVQFEGVSLCYRKGASDALTDVSFRAHPGEIIGVIGGTGAGKTSLVNLIPRFYEATRGSIRVGGTDVREQDPEALRRRVAVVPQKALLFAGSIRDNLLWGSPKADDETLMKAVEIAQAKDVLDAKGGLDGMLEQGGLNLSGGQRQRLTIARALVKKCDVLILDDSASALDYATEARLRHALRAMENRPTLFIVSQRAVSVRDADKILVMEDGRLVDSGSHAELMDRCRVYREIVRSQNADREGGRTA